MKDTALVFPQGKDDSSFLTHIPRYKNFLGYERGAKKDDPPVVNPEQAVTVRRIYRMFMEGKTVGMIARELTAEEVPTPSGKSVWCASTVNSILQNEKYRGSALLQKKFTTDYLTKSQKINEGEVPSYYVEKSHEPIIVPDEWEAVQEELARRKVIGRSYSGKSVLGAKIRCGDCGSWYGEKVWHSTDSYKSRVWQCNGKYDKSRPRCGTPALREEDIKQRFLAAFNSLIADKEAYIAACEATKAVLTDTAAIDAEMKELLGEMEIVAGLTKKCIEENSTTAQDQDEYAERYNGYVERYEKAKARYDELAALRKEKQTRAGAIDRFIAELRKREELLTVFDNRLWLTVVDYAEVQRDGTLTFHFCDGTKKHS